MNATGRRFGKTVRGRFKLAESGRRAELPQADVSLTVQRQSVAAIALVRFIVVVDVVAGVAIVVYHWF